MLAWRKENHFLQYLYSYISTHVLSLNCDDDILLILDVMAFTDAEVEMAHIKHH